MSCVYLLKDAIYATHSLRVPSLFFTSRLCWWIDVRAKAFLHLTLGFVLLSTLHEAHGCILMFLFFFLSLEDQKDMLLYCYSNCEIHSSALCIYLFSFFYIG